MKITTLSDYDDDFHRRLDAFEFAAQADGGKDPRALVIADIVLIGVSRTSKTPLCMYLANKFIKAANVPLIPEIAPPEELFQLPRNRVVGLTAKPEVLAAIRQERLKTLGLISNADYATLGRVKKENEYAQKIMEQIGCPVIDVSNKAIEETASEILQIYYRGE